MKLEELSLNTKVEIDTKHQGFYGYKTKKINQSKDNNKTIKKHKKKNKNNKLVSKLDNKFWNLIKHYFLDDYDIKTDKMNVENDKNIRKVKVKFYNPSTKPQTQYNNESMKDDYINNSIKMNIKPSFIKNLNKHIKKVEVDDMDIEYKVHYCFNNDCMDIDGNELDGHRPGVLYVGVVCGMCQHKRGTMLM